MGPDSRIVIDEVVLPDEKLPWQVAYSKPFSDPHGISGLKI